jgi:hypothetical protein
MSQSDSELSELDDYGFEEDEEGMDEPDNIEAEDDDVSMSDVECEFVGISSVLSEDQYTNMIRNCAAGADEDDGGLDDGDLGVGSSGKGKGKAAYQVDYTPLSKRDLEAEMKKEISHVASALSLKVSLKVWLVAE